MDGETRVSHETSNTKAETRSSKEGESLEEERTRAPSKRCTSTKNDRKTKTGNSCSMVIASLNFSGPSYS